MALTADDHVNSAELALGVLEGEDRAAALRRVLAEPEFAHQVSEWRDSFATLLLSYPEVEPPAWIERRLIGIADNARPWRWATGLASALAAGLALTLGIRMASAPPAPSVPRQANAPLVTFAAAMTPTKPDQGTPFAALFDASLGQVRMPIGVDIPSNRVAQLWRIGGDGVPHSLGLLAGRGTTALTLSTADRDALAAGATLAISIEPIGGSPTTLPTGPVVATGQLTRI